MSRKKFNSREALLPPPLTTITRQSPTSGSTLAPPPTMPPTSLTMSLCSRQRDALKRLLHAEGIDDQPHHDLDSLLHILLVRMQQEGWTIDTRGRLMTPSQSEHAQQRVEAATTARRNEDTMSNSADGRGLRRKVTTNSQTVDGERRRYRDTTPYVSPYDNIDDLPRPPPLVALPPPFLRAGGERVGNGMPRGYVPYMDRGSAYRSKYQGKNSIKNLIKGAGKGDHDEDPHYIEEDAVFEFWLANIWKPVDSVRALEERKAVVVSKKGWFRGLWTGKK